MPLSLGYIFLGEYVLLDKGKKVNEVRQFGTFQLRTYLKVRYLLYLCLVLEKNY